MSSRWLAPICALLVLITGCQIPLHFHYHATAAKLSVEVGPGEDVADATLDAVIEDLHDAADCSKGFSQERE